MPELNSVPSDSAEKRAAVGVPASTPCRGMAFTSGGSLAIVAKTRPECLLSSRTAQSDRSQPVRIPQWRVNYRTVWSAWPVSIRVFAAVQQIRADEWKTSYDQAEQRSPWRWPIARGRKQVCNNASLRSLCDTGGRHPSSSLRFCRCGWITGSFTFRGR